MKGIAIVMLILSGVGLLIAIFLAVMVSIHIISDMVSTKKYYDELDNLEERLSGINNVSNHDDSYD